VREDEFVWNEDGYPSKNFAALGKRLAASGDLFANACDGNGLLLVLPDGKHRKLTKGAELAPIIVDRVPVRVIKNGKPKGGKIDHTHLNAMLRSKVFLDQFMPVDEIISTPLYLPDFSLARPGYNDGGPGFRILYVGPEADVSDSLATVNSFLDVMEFETNADRTNTVAAALTVALRNHWPGGKPIILATATKSHAGKDTVISFAAGVAGLVSISYQATNWAFERSFVGAVKTAPDAAVIVVENARLDRKERFIASAFLERFATDPEPMLFSTGTGEPIRIKNNLVLGITTNYGTVSEDLLNRSLHIHLHPIGDVASRRSPIGNPKLEFLPACRKQIAAEIRGMIERWKAAGQPLDDDARHPFSIWAKVIGGILKVNGFTDFLGNYGTRRVYDDPIRHALGLAGAHKPEKWLRPAEWATVAGEAGVTKILIPERDRENDISRARAMGVLLSAHIEETFSVEGESRVLSLRLERSRHRRSGSEAKMYYRFVEVASEDLPHAS
jgi:hypothetical protein